MKDDAIVLSAADRVAGQEREVRGTWKPESKEGVRETAVVSMDGGKTRTPWFDILFRPHQALLSQGDSPNPMYSHMEAGMAADETTLRQLNDQYVEAFMKADTEWCRAHLKDDFVCIESDAGSFLPSSPQSASSTTSAASANK
jgi:hypothetical protein